MAQDPRPIPHLAIQRTAAVLKVNRLFKTTIGNWRRTFGRAAPGPAPNIPPYKKGAISDPPLSTGFFKGPHSGDEGARQRLSFVPAPDADQGRSAPQPHAPGQRARPLPHPATGLDSATTQNHGRQIGRTACAGTAVLPGTTTTPTQKPTCQDSEIVRSNAARIDPRSDPGEGPAIDRGG